MSTINFKVVGLDKVMDNLGKTGRDLPGYLNGARLEVTDTILNTKGLRSYPPATSANQPPTPYYIRGRGTQYANRNAGNSERLGTRWKSINYGRIGMKISNPASYAPYVHGDNQARAMGRIGWRKLYDVAKEKTGVIKSIYDKWVSRLLKKHGL